MWSAFIVTVWMLLIFIVTDITVLYTVHKKGKLAGAEKKASNKAAQIFSLLPWLTVSDQKKSIIGQK